MSDDDPIIIEPVGPAADAAWAPVAGPETIDFLESVVPEGSRHDVCDAAIAILGKGVAPTAAAGQETGLVVGYVQSGKTMSFETVATLARDNGFQIVIVVAGTSNPLLEQSTGRLRRDLRLDEPDRERRWIQFQNPGTEDANVQAIRDVLNDWADPATPADYKKTVLITVLKRYDRLQNLANLMDLLGLAGAPVLIIDDEADQASLNTEVAQGSESSTYLSLMALRDALPNHTYLQYTATPQAPLLVSIIDSLSPNFVRVLEAGEEYVGGREFFGGSNALVRVIPAQQVPSNANPLAEPPETLLEALRVFMVGVTAGIRQSSNRGNRSMLVQPTEPGRTLYAAVPVANHPRWFVAKDSESHACLMFETARSEAARRAPIVLENFDGQFAMRCRLHKKDAPDSDGVFTVIRCRSHDIDTTRYFLSACEAVLRLAGPSPAPGVLAIIVQRLAALFRRLERPATRSLNGLFGELFVIWRSSDPAYTLAAWRTDVEARFDFSVADVRLDVKTASGRMRTHICSYDQCNPPDGTVAIAASLFTERSPGGLSVGAIVDEIEDAVGNDAALALKLREVTAATLGATLTESMRATFDIALADSSLELYDLRGVPALRDPLAMGVSDVHFRSDFSLATPLDDLPVSGDSLRRLVPSRMGF